MARDGASGGNGGGRGGGGTPECFASDGGNGGGGARCLVLLGVPATVAVAEELVLGGELVPNRLS